MAVLTISRQFGAGGKTLGERLARRLGYQFVDRHLISDVAKEANVSVDWVVAVERETSGRLMQILSKMVSGNFIERQLADSGSDFDEKKYIAFLKKVITDLAEEGNVVILGRGAEYILPDTPGIFKVLLVASWEDRIKFLENQYSITHKQASGLVEKEEKKRTAFLRKLDPRDPNDPILYHLCLNHSRVSMERSEEIILNLMRDYTSVPG